MKKSRDENVKTDETFELIHGGEQPGNFEDAITATGFGRFNIALLCIIIPGSFAQIAEQTSLSYVIPIAQCDLNLTLEDKGVLVSISYTGMILSAFLWGYICDTYGRRKIIIYGYLTNSICYLISALSQNFSMLLTAKFISGFVFTGPFSAVTSYLSEFHSTANRSRVQLIRGTASGLAVIILPMIAWMILPHIYEITVTDNITLHSWNVFLVICSLPALITGVMFVFMPESPKFLMASGKTSEALTVFKTVYKANTGRRSSSFPIKALMEEKRQINNARTVKESSTKETMLQGFLNMKPLFGKPYFLRLVLACINAVTLLIGAFGVKLWYPQILQAINDFGKIHEGDEIYICNIVDSLAYRNTSTTAVCTVNLENSSVYINASIQGAMQLVAFILAGLSVNRTGKKPLIVTLAIAAATCPMLIYLITNETIMLMLFPVIVVFAEICGNISVTISMEMFPTAFRTTALNIHMMHARIGIAVGNVVLPYLLKAGCLPSLVFISVSLIVSAGLTILLPNTDNDALQ